MTVISLTDQELDNRISEQDLVAMLHQRPPPAQYCERQANRWSDAYPYLPRSELKTSPRYHPCSIRTANAILRRCRPQMVQAE
jgi:hypothetical protein